jgi:hypothetical protein
MSGKLRWDDPRCGREGFDGRAGWEWEHGPDPHDTTGLIPDEPWHELKAGKRVLFANDQWAVTPDGLEALYFTDAQRYEPYDIPADSLLRTHNRGRVYFWPVDVAARPWFDFDMFEEAFRKAVDLHCRKQKWIVVDDQLLETSFRRARAIAREATRARDRAARHST